MDMATRVQILDEAVCILHTANIGMNTTILSPAMGKILSEIGLFNFCMAASLGEGKLWIQTS